MYKLHYPRHIRFIHKRAPYLKFFCVLQGLIPCKTTLKFKYLQEFKPEFKNVLGYELGPHMGSIQEKNRGQKSRATVPLSFLPDSFRKLPLLAAALINHITCWACPTPNSSWDRHCWPQLHRPSSARPSDTVRGWKISPQPRNCRWREAYWDLNLCVHCILFHINKNSWCVLLCFVLLGSKHLLTAWVLSRPLLRLLYGDIGFVYPACLWW
jgi:hypothetical protein